VTMSGPPLPGSYEDLLGRARIQDRDGDTEGSIALYRRLVDRLGGLSDRILARRPELKEMQLQARLELTNLLYRQGRYAEAIEVEKVLLDTHPDQAETWRHDLAVLRIQRGEVNEGLADLRALAEEKPDDAGRWIILGRETRIEGRFADSLAALDRALETAADQDAKQLGEIYYERFRLLKDMGRPDDAAAAWENAVRADPELGRTLGEVYSMFTDVGRFSEAQRYVARDENKLQAGFQRGLIASLAGNPTEARQRWREVARLDPDEFEYGHDAWVEAVLRLGNPDPALEWLQESLGRVGTPRLLILSGIGWAMRKDGEMASKLFQYAINVLRRVRPPKQKLDGADWRLLDSLVRDDELKKTLKPYFAVVETLWK
jgi:tetratricopeptide (TPR) repeat protein